MRFHHCVCRATLQFSNNDPKESTNYIRSRLILPRGVQYNDRLYPTILEPQNHHGLLIDPTMGNPYLMEVVGDFRAADPIFKGCYGDSLLYFDADLCRLRWWKIHLSMFQGEIPVPPAPSYWQVREPAATKQSPHKVAASDTPAESPKAKCPNEALDAAPMPQLQSAQILHPPRNPLAPWSQPQTIRRSLHRSTALTSTAIHPLLPQGQPDANEKIFAGRTLAQSTLLFPSAPACLMPSAVRRVPSAT